MKKSKILTAYLVISGLLLTFIGGAMLLFPVTMKGTAGIDISGSVSVINDVRASAALILSVALLSILGAFRARLTYTSSLIVTTLFISLGIGRVISMVIDGMPVDGLVKAAGLELVLGVLGVILFAKYQSKN